MKNRPVASCACR